MTCITPPGSPARPVSAPVLVPSQDSEQTGQFFVSLSHSAPRTNNQEHPLSPVAVVYRIQDQKTHVTMFHSQVGRGQKQMANSCNKTVMK